jgi:hypothetical protein
MKLRPHRPRTGRPSYPAGAPLSVRQFCALVAVLVGALLLIPGTAQAAVAGTVAFITDPLNTGHRARVDANGNLLVATGRQPVQVQKFVDFSSGINVTADIFTVPAGKRLLIQSIQGTVNYPGTNPRPTLVLNTTVGGDVEQWVIDTPVPGAAASGFLNFHGTVQMSLYADPGTTLRIFVGSQTSVTGDTVGVLQLSGVLVDATAGVA